MIITSNVRVKKLNSHRRQHHLDKSNNELVSDEEVEDPILDPFSSSSLVIQNPVPPGAPHSQFPHPHPNPTPGTNASYLNLILVRTSPTNLVPQSDNTSLILPIDWKNVVTGESAQAHTSDPLSTKATFIDYQHLSPIYSMEDLVKNKQQLDMTDVPKTVLQMAYNNIYIPLSMLTTSIPSKIFSNDNLKYCKIPFGNV